MPRRWQVWGQPDGSLVWVPTSDAPPAPPPPLAAAPPLPPIPLPLAAAALAPAASSDDALIKGAGAADGCRVRSMANLLTEARNKLIEGDGMAGATDDAGKGGMFCTGSGRSVAVSDRAIRRARALVGEEAEETSNKRRNLEGELRETDVSFRGGVHKDSTPPMFQTGSGKAVSLSKDSIRKARAVLEGNAENAASAIQPIFHTGMGRLVPVSRDSIDKARAVLEGQKIAKQGNTEGFGRPDQSLMFLTGSRRPVLIRERSTERSRAVVKEGGAENSGHWDTAFQFQTGLRRAVAVSQTSIQKARTVLEEENIKRSGHGDTSICATIFQTETPRSVLMSSSLIMNDGTVTPERDTAMQEKNHEDVHLPLFQTGSGRLVSVSKSSIKRASAVLEPRNIAKELEDEANLVGGHSTPMFKTGLGRSILVSENSRKKAQVVLEAEEAVKSVNNHIGEGFAEDPAFHAGIREFAPQNISSSHKANTLLEQGNFAKKGYEDCGSQLPMFRTRSGKSVLICENSVHKARAVLEEEGNANKDNHKLHNNMDKKFPIFASPLKTSCARTVNISSVCVSRAATLLGLEENTLSTQSFGHVGDKLGAKITVERENPEHRLGVASAHGISGGCPRSSCPTENRVFMDQQQPFGFLKNAVSDSGEHPIRFSTAGGISMAISSDALQCAKSLLGESDLAVAPKDLIGHSLASACKGKLPTSTVAPKEYEYDLSKISRAKGKAESATFSHQAMPDRKHTGSFGFAVPGTHMTNGSANRFHVGREYRPGGEIPKIPKPSSRCLSEADSASDTKDKTPRLHMPAGALVDITKYIGTHSGNMDDFAIDKRRIGGRNSIPFKRPRSSRFVTPINTNKLSSAGVSKQPPTQISPCRTNLSACYPFQHQRKTCKEYFGGPPCFKYLKEDVTDEVELMDTKRAEKYKFQNTDTGAEEFQKMLLACGA